MTEYALALDIGGSHVTAACVDLGRRELIGKLSRRLVDSAAGAEVILGAWEGAALDALETGTPERIGVAVPSPFEHKTEISRMTHKFAALCGVNVRSELRARWRARPSKAFRCVSATTPICSPWASGGTAWRGTSRMIGVTLGTGLGSGLVWNSPYLSGIAEDFSSGRAVTQFYEARSGQVLVAAQVAALADGGDSGARAA